ncbi:GbsR/MarR family transcriptional regulator [Streptomyces phytohabitans]|uniref:GbsR/MarR family transcriptional regulator n=1 Tax=Streptomyces phytohabitans TaxID=1150371 RepID=UPI00345C5C17
MTAQHHPERRPEDYDARVSPFVERFAADLTEAGMQRMAARVFACLLASEQGALSSAELSDRLRCSPAAVSGAVRYLSQVHMISREREPGSRRERYRLHQDIWYETFTNRDAFLDRWTATLRSGSEALGPDTEAGRRVRETTEFFDYLKGELGGLLERWRAQRDATGGGPGGAEPPRARD